MKNTELVAGTDSCARARRPRPFGAITLALACVVLPAVHLVDWPSECEGLVVAEQRCFPGLPPEQSMSTSRARQLEGNELATYCRESRQLLERSCR